MASMPRTADPAQRIALIELAAHRLGAAEPVTLRAVAESAGTSTMAIYTHFGGMPGLWSAVREEGFRRLSARLARLRPSEDSVRDVAATGAAYVGHALREPDLYRTMFDQRYPLSDPQVADAPFGVLVAAVERACAARRFGRDVQADNAATQLWAMTHGVVSLVLSEALTVEAMVGLEPEMFVAACVSFGDRRAAAATSVAAGWMTLAHAERLSRLGRRATVPGAQRR